MRRRSWRRSPRKGSKGVRAVDKRDLRQSSKGKMQAIPFEAIRQSSKTSLQSKMRNCIRIRSRQTDERKVLDRIY